MKTYLVSVTDTYGGEANYSYVNNLKIAAKSLRACILKLGKETGLSWRFNSDYGDSVRYNSKGGLTCAFIEVSEEVETQ